MHIFMKFILAHLWMELMLNHSLAQYPPIQQQCLGRQSVPYSSDVVTKLGNYPEWFVATVTVLTQDQLPYNVFPPSINTCAPLSYLQSCYNGAIHIHRNFLQDGSISQLTSAYNPPDGTIMNYFEERTIDDRNYFIFSGYVSLMKLYQEIFGEVQNILEIDQNFPDFVTYTEGSQYSMLDYFEEEGVITWAVYEDCTRQLAWIEINQWVLENNKINKVYSAIRDFLTQRTDLNLPQMVSITTDLPFLTPDQRE